MKADFKRNTRGCQCIGSKARKEYMGDHVICICMKCGKERGQFGKQMTRDGYVKTRSD